MKGGTQDHRIPEQSELEGAQQEQVYCFNDTSFVTEDMQGHHLVLNYFTYQYSNEYNQSVIKLWPHTEHMNLPKLRNTGLLCRQVPPAPLILTNGRSATKTTTFECSEVQIPLSQLKSKCPQ